MKMMKKNVMAEEEEPRVNERLITGRTNKKLILERERIYWYNTREEGE